MGDIFRILKICGTLYIKIHLKELRKQNKTKLDHLSVTSDLADTGWRQ